MMSISQTNEPGSLPGDLTQLSRNSLPSLVAASDKDGRLDLLPDTLKPPRTFRYLAKQLMTAQIHSDTGLEGLPHREFLALARSRHAFFHASEENLYSPQGTYSLREGWWSSLLNNAFLTDPQGKDFLMLLSRLSKDGVVAEIGPGAQLETHQRLFRRALGAKLYLSCDINRESTKSAATYLDALTYFSLIKSESLNAIVAFGVFNEPMSLQYPSWAPPRFFLPAASPAAATRAHCEHEYVRRLGREMYRALKPGGMLLGDGLHSRKCETEVARYIERAGFTPCEDGHRTLSGVDLEAFAIRDPFFFAKR